MSQPVTEWTVAFLRHSQPIPAGCIFSTLAHTHHGWHVAGLLIREVRHA